MPRVPQLDNVSVLPGVRPTPQARMLDAPEVRDFGSRQLLAQSEALGRAGSVATGIAADMQAQANMVRLDDAQNRLMAVETDLRIKTSALKGRNALERPDGKALPDEMGEEFDKAVREIEDGLGNDYQRQAFRSSASQIGTRFRGAVAQHMVGEQRTFEVETAKSGIAVAVDRAIKLAGDDRERVASLTVIDRHLDALAKTQGWSPEALAEARLDARSKVHSGLIATMIASGQSGEAKRYYDANSADMTVQARATILPKLQEANDAQQGDSAAAAAWAKIGPKSPNDAIKQFDMEAQVREALKDNPAAQKVAIVSLRERAAAFNAQQAELKATNIAGVWGLMDRGAPMAQIQQSDAWLALTDTERRQIRREREAELYQAESRAAARASRAAAEAQRGAAEASRELTRLRTSDALALINNGAEYLTASDPAVLSQMSRAQVEALRGKFGLEGTQHLLSKHEALQKPGKIAEARMDQDDFNRIADQLGMKPFDRSKSESQARALGELKFRVEQIIDARQRQTGKTLERDEKLRLMQDEMAKTVTTDGWFSLERHVPVIQLTDRNLGDVQVPATDRKQITDALRARGQQVTEQAIRRMYITRISPAAAPMVPNER
ncbi:MAG: hypothetical protein KA200_00090 [Burkholderiales bacterium]|nr:hypothetical protein [Burkholderiales bacterium]